MRHLCLLSSTCSLIFYSSFLLPVLREQADVEYGDLEKHTILDWADGTALDLEGSDLDETLFVHKGLALCLDDWTKNTSEYSDFWDSL